MKKCLAIAILFVFMAPSLLRADNLEITSFASTLQINPDGTLSVREKIGVRFYTELHGIYRLLPVYSTVYGKTYRVRFGGFESDQPLRVRRNGTDIELRMGRANRLVSGDQTYSLGYRADKVILTQNPDYDELYWNVTGNGWDNPIDSTRIEIVLPCAIELGGNADYEVFAGDAGSDRMIAGSRTGPGPNVRNVGVFSGSNLVSVTAASNRLILDVPVRLEPYQGITVRFRFDKGVVNIPPFKAFLNAAGAFLNDWLYLIAAFLLFAASFIIWLKYGKDKKVPPIVTEFFPPEKLSPSEANSILRQRAKFDIAATLIDLAARGYLVIGEDDDGVYLEKTGAEQSGLRGYEKNLISKLFSSKYTGKDAKTPKVSVKNLKKKFYKDFDTISTSYEEYFLKQGYFEQSGSEWQIVFNILKVLSAIFLAALILGIFREMPKLIVFTALALVNNIVFSIVMPKKTVRGLEIYTKILGFKRFVMRADKDRIARLMAENPRYFDDTVPYAIVFGLAKKWGKVFDGILTEPPDWYKSERWRSGRYRNFMFMRTVSSQTGRIGRAAASRVVSFRSSGRGYSGGGFGGGGGGGW